MRPWSGEFVVCCGSQQWGWCSDHTVLPYSSTAKLKAVPYRRSRSCIGQLKDTGLGDAAFWPNHESLFLSGPVRRPFNCPKYYPRGYIHSDHVVDHQLLALRILLH